MNLDKFALELAVPMPGRRVEARLPLAYGPVEANDASAPRELAAFVATSLRNHGHLGNVLTHISGGNWKRVEEALYAILDPYADSGSLTPLACNVIELMCADRGVTGRMLKPYYQELLIGALGEAIARCVIDNVTALFTDLEAKGRNPVRSRPATTGQPGGKMS